MNAKEIKKHIKEFLTTNFGTSDEPCYTNMKTLQQLAFEVETDLEREKEE